MKLGIGSTVKILIGSFKGTMGIYKGIVNNSNWHRVEFADGSYVLLNPEEFEKV